MIDISGYTETFLLNHRKCLTLSLNSAFFTETCVVILLNNKPLRNHIKFIDWKRNTWAKIIAVLMKFNSIYLNNKSMDEKVKNNRCELLIVCTFYRRKKNWMIDYYILCQFVFHKIFYLPICSYKTNAKLVVIIWSFYTQ